MEQSTEINELAKALSVAQGMITGAVADSENPFFRSKYADLASCWDACRKPLSDAGLAVIQAAESDAEGVTVVTTLAHQSGQWLRGTLRMVPKDSSPQAFGSALTYARRYSLAAMVGLAQVDEDAEPAQKRVTPTDHGERMTAKQVGYAREFAENFRKALTSDVDESLKAAQIASLGAEANEDAIVMTEAWKLLTAPERGAIKKYMKQGA